MSEETSDGAAKVCKLSSLTLVSPDAALRSPRRPRPRRPSPRAGRAGLSAFASKASTCVVSLLRISSVRASLRPSGRLRASPLRSLRPLRPPRSERPSPRSPRSARPSVFLPSGRSVRCGRSVRSVRSARSPPRASPRPSPRRPPRRPSPRASPRPPSRRSPGLPVVLRVAGVSGVASLPPNKPLSQPKKPFSAGAFGVTAAARGAAVRSGLAGRASAGGAGKSGSTPLMTGVCLLVGSWERRVTAVGSSISSAIL